MSIFDKYPNAPQFDCIKYFLQSENVRITDASQDAIVAACDGRWSQYDSYEKEFVEWLIANGKIQLDEPIAISKEEVKAVVGNMPVIVEYAKQSVCWEWQGKRKWFAYVRYGFEVSYGSKYGEVTTHSYRTEIVIDAEWVKKDWDNQI